MCILCSLAFVYTPPRIYTTHPHLHTLVITSLDDFAGVVLDFPSSFILCQFPYKDLTSTPSLHRPRSIITHTNCQPHPPAITTKPKGRNTPLHRGIILHSLSSHRIPHRNGAISPSRSECPVKRMPCQCIHW